MGWAGLFHLIYVYDGLFSSLALNWAPHFPAFDTFLTSLVFTPAESCADERGGGRIVDVVRKHSPRSGTRPCK